MRCPDERMVVGLFDRSLTPRREAVVSKHVEECAHCRERVDKLKTVDRLLDASLGPAPDPSRVIARVLDRIADQGRDGSEGEERGLPLRDC